MSRLEALIGNNSETTRIAPAWAAKQQGQRIIGVMGSYVPEEIIIAAGLFPWRVTGSFDSDISLATAYRSASSCLYCNHVLQSLLKGEYDFLDGVVIADWDQDFLRIFDTWDYVGKTSFVHIIHVPHVQSERCCTQYKEELRRFSKSLEGFCKSKITDSALSNAINMCNGMRGNLKRLYELRKRERPPLSGAQVLGITISAGVMPKEDFSHELEACLPIIGKQQASLSHFRPRILVSSEMLDNFTYIEAIEEAGCLVAMDDLDTGSRYFWETVKTNASDPIDALARRYMFQPAAPRMMSWDKQLDQVIQWVKDFDIDGVIELNQMYSTVRACRTPYFKRRLSEASIPSISIEREYHPANLGQLKTKVGAFLEILTGRG